MPGTSYFFLRAPHVLPRQLCALVKGTTGITKVRRFWVGRHGPPASVFFNRISGLIQLTGGRPLRVYFWRPCKLALLCMVAML